MAILNLKLDGDGAYPDLAGKEIIHLADDATLGVTGLAGGMRSGRASVGLRFDLPDGRVVFAETSLRLFLLAADALRAHYPGG